jgi:hypothetical protein
MSAISSAKTYLGIDGYQEESIWEGKVEGYSDVAQLFKNHPRNPIF